MTDCTWREFEVEAPELAEAGRRLLEGDDGIAIGFLATASGDGAPHLSPVCPIFSGSGLFVSAAGSTPKVRDLRENGRFTLHAFLGDDDEEFQVRGLVREVEVDAERAAVHEAIRFGAFDRDHPIFELCISGTLWVHWERAGQPDTRAVRRPWCAAGSRQGSRMENGTRR